MKLTIKDISMMAILLAVLIVCSKISFPIGVISITLQTFAVAILSYILKLKKSLIVIITYIVIGLIGLPVFSTGGGISYLLIPSFGFILGFIPFSIILSTVKNIFLSMTSLLVLYIIGSIYMFLILTIHLDKDVNLLYVLQAAVFPFIIKDVVSILLAKFIYIRLEKIEYLQENKGID